MNINKCEDVEQNEDKIEKWFSDKVSSFMKSYKWMALWVLMWVSNQWCASIDYSVETRALWPRNLNCESYDSYQTYAISKTAGNIWRRVKDFERKCVFDWFMLFDKHLDKYTETEDEKSFRMLKMMINSTPTRNDLEKMVTYLEAWTWVYDNLDELYLEARMALKQYTWTTDESESINENNEVIDRLPDFDLDFTEAHYEDDFWKNYRLRNSDNTYIWKRWNAHYYRLEFKWWIFRKNIDLKVQLRNNKLVITYEFNSKAYTEYKNIWNKTIITTDWDNKIITNTPDINVEIHRRQKRSKEELKLKFKISNYSI